MRIFWEVIVCFITLSKAGCYSLSAMRSTPQALRSLPNSLPMQLWSSPQFTDEETEALRKLFRVMQLIAELRLKVWFSFRLQPPHPLHSSPGSRCSRSRLQFRKQTHSSTSHVALPFCNCGHVYASPNKAKRDSTPRSSFLNHLHNSDFSPVPSHHQPSPKFLTFLNWNSVPIKH